MDTIGKRIAFVRKERGLSQETLAELVDISTQYMSIIENDKKNMSVEVLTKIADVLNVTTDFIIYGRESSDENFLINSIINTLSFKNKKHATKLIEVFADAVNDKIE